MLDWFDLKQTYFRMHVDTIDCNKKGSLKTKEVGHQIIVSFKTAFYLRFDVFYLFGLYSEECFLSEKKLVFLPLL